MFLRERATQAEYFDSPARTFEEVASGYRELGRINRLFRFADPFQRLLPKTLGESGCRSLRILDLGAGDGSLGRELSGWAVGRGWDWQVTSLDLNPLALRLNPGRLNVAASATALPFADRSFDVVISTQMTHHLESDEDVRRHFREAWRVADRLVSINDLHRGAVLYLVMFLVLQRTFGFSPAFRADGLLSIRRGWRAEEWRRLAEQAGIPSEVSVYHGSRIILQAIKSGPETRAATKRSKQPAPSPSSRAPAASTA